MPNGPSIGSVVVSLKIGSELPTPAPASLMQALQKVEVTQTDEVPSGFQLTFHTEIDNTTSQDYAVVQDDLLQLFNRVVISVVVNGVSTTLMDGFITGQQLVPSGRPGGSMFVVTGEDISVKMDAVEYSLEYPALGDAAIVAVVLAKYLFLGVIPEVIPTISGAVPFGWTPLQNCSDRAWVSSLAQQNGALFYVTPGPAPMTNVAYWGPPKLSEPLQDPLNVNMGPFTNVEQISFGIDGLKPFFVVGSVLETLTDPYLPVPVATLSSTREPALATKPVLEPSALVSLSVKKKLWIDQGFNPVKSAAVAQGMTDLSTDQVVTATGRLDVSRYANVLTAPGMVGVRGTGTNYDGKYYVKSVQHQISTRSGDWSYLQDFTLNREGLGTTTRRV
ncbi:MAG: hypothetical protein AAF799_20695 [Myxococcota bacterium]